MMCANDGVHYGPMAAFVCLHITLPHHHHHADVYEGIEFLKKIHSVECLRLSQLSQLSFMQYIGLGHRGLLSTTSDYQTC